MFFVSYIARMDVLFEASFSPLSSSGETVFALVLGGGGTGHTQLSQVNLAAGGPRQSLTSEIRIT